MMSTAIFMNRFYDIDRNLIYYEVEIGTSRTDCGPSYPNELYNVGYKISRGVPRIVYSNYYIDRMKPVNPEDSYFFYTYDYYNDFKEYLNYDNG